MRKVAEALAKVEVRRRIKDIAGNCHRWRSNAVTRVGNHALLDHASSGHVGGVAPLDGDR
jgi:hypothetical protein